ncbi:MAG: c-type cytochrome [Candidatus Acidiferrum sp.]
MAALVCASALVLASAMRAQDMVPSNNTSKPAHPAAEEGRPLFESLCAGCHGLDGRGGERGPDISTRPQVMQLSDAEILHILDVGRPAAGMPPFGSLGSAKLQALLTYLRSLQGKGATTGIPGDAAKGKTLFFGKARCAECHMVQGEGGFIGRDLSAYGATLSAGEIRANIEHPPSGTDKASKIAVVTMRDSRKFSGVIRNEDNFSMQLQSLDGTFHFLNRADVKNVEFEAKPIMPDDYVSKLRAAELDDLVGYLMTVARTQGQKSVPTDGEDEN